MYHNKQKLNFENFKQFDLYKIKAIGDGSCLLHAIALAYFKNYIGYKIDKTKLYHRRRKIIKNLRRTLACKLEDINPFDLENRTYYESLGNGSISELGQDIYEYSLEGMKDLLNSNSQLGDEVIEYIQLVLNKSLYFIYENTQDVFNYSYGVPPNQDSICLYVTEGHYDLIACGEYTYFDHNHEFILYLKEKIRNQSQN